MKLPRVLAFLLLSTAVFGSDQDEVFRHKLTERTKLDFIAVCAELSKKPVITGNFELRKSIEKLRRTIVSRGVFLVSAGDGMVWDTQKPFPSTMVLGRDVMTQTSPGGGRVRISAEGNEAFLSIAEIMIAVFSGKSETLLEHFEVYFSGSRAAWNIGLLPKEKALQRAAQKIVLSGGEYIDAIVLYQQNGDTVTYILGEQTQAETLKEHEKSFFIFE